MGWPTPQEYNEAIQNPAFCFSDPELKQGKPELDRLGFPRPRSGSFASVYNLRCGQNEWAVRCFYKQVQDQEKRYEAISNHLKKTNLPYFVPFEYISKGILVQGTWYPIVKMQWIQGEGMISYLKRNLNNPQVLKSLNLKWLKMITTLHDAKIAHGDLQHGNILIYKDDFILIDYDGIYVPALQGFNSSEVGHRNYQHPSRNNDHFGEHIDNFSAWVIFISLMALAIDSSLWDIIGVDEDKERLLFGQDDFVSPATSQTFHLLQMIQDTGFTGLVDYFQHALTLGIDAIASPGASVATPIVVNLSPTKATVASTGSSPYPEWLRGMIGAEVALTTQQPALTAATSNGASWILDHLQSDIRRKDFDVKMVQDRLVMLFLLLTPALAVSLFAYTPLFVSSGGLVGAVLSTTYSYLRFNRFGLVKERKQFAIQKRDIKKEMADMNASLDKLVKEKAELAKNKQKTISKLNQSMSRIQEEEKIGLESLETDLQETIKDLENQKRQLIQKEAIETAYAKETFQSKWMQSQLVSHTIAKEQIYGIGTAMKQRLAANGIHTAADIVDVKYYAYGQYGNQRASIKLSNGRFVHVDGIGPAKAEALWQWKQNIEGQYRNRMPNLPKAEIDAIRNKYVNQKGALDSQIQQAKQKTQQDKSTVKQKYTKQQADLKMQIQVAEHSSMQQILKLDHEIQKKTNDITAKRWEEAQLQKMSDLYKAIRFINYLRKLFFVG